MNTSNSSIPYRHPQGKDENAFGNAPFGGAEYIRDQPRAVTEKPVGSGLTAADYAALEARWIDRSLADLAGLRRVDSLTGGEIVGRRSGNYAGIIIPYFRPGEVDVREYRLRRDQPDLEYDCAGNFKPRRKYLSPPGRSNMLYLVAGTDPLFLRDTSIPIVITEGEFKTLALFRLAKYRSSSAPRFLPVGVSGVYNWRGTIGKTVGPDGSRLDAGAVVVGDCRVGSHGGRSANRAVRR